MITGARQRTCPCRASAVKVRVLRHRTRRRQIASDAPRRPVTTIYSATKASGRVNRIAGARRRWASPAAKREGGAMACDGRILPSPPGQLGPGSIPGAAPHFVVADRRLEEAAGAVPGTTISGTSAAVVSSSPSTAGGFRRGRRRVCANSRLIGRATFARTLRPCRCVVNRSPGGSSAGCSARGRPSSVGWAESYPETWMRLVGGSTTMASAA